MAAIPFGAPTRTSNEEALAAEPEVVELLKNFCKFDSEALKLAAEDAVVNPPGAPPMPVGVMTGMMDAMKGSTFPNWKSHCHGVTKNPDGTYRVLTQQCPGPMKADFPAMGPFPHVALSSVPEVLTTEDLANPVEWGTFTLSEDKSKVVSAAYVITSHLDTGMLGKGSKSVEAVWGKAGDGSDVGFGAYFKLMGVELTPPPAAPPSKLDVVAKFKTTAWDGTYKEDVAEGATFVHGGQEMPVDAFFGWCTAVGLAKSFPHWEWTTASCEELADGRVKMGTRQATGKMCADLPAIGPFPEVTLAEVPAGSLLLTDKGAVLPVEIGFYSFDAAGKVSRIEYTGEFGDTSEANTMDNTPPVGPPLLYALAGKPLPPPA